MFTLITNYRGLKYGKKHIMTGSTLQGELTEYTKEIFNITSYCSKLSKITLPILREANWIDTDVIRKFNEMKLVPEMWLNNGILKELKQVPDSILSYDLLYQRFEDSITNKLQQMLAEPEKVTDEQNKELALQIEIMATEVNRLGMEAKNLYERMEELHTKIKSSTIYFSNLYNNVCDTKLADQKESEKLQNEISILNQKIKDINNSEIGMLVVEGVAGIIAIIGTILDLVWLQIITATVILLTNITSFALVEVLGDEIDKINQKKLTLNNYTYDLTLIGILKTELEETASCIDAATTSVAQIGSLWQNLQNTLYFIAQTLRNGETKLTQQLYKDILDNMRETAVEWASIVKISKNILALHIEPDLHAKPIEFHIL